MNVSLTKEFESYVNDKVESGLYQTASEVIRDGLRLMKERDELHQTKLAELRREIALGAEQADRGQVRVFDEELVALIKREGRQRLVETSEAVSE
jgi:antitoxin ParD1/3/4